MANRWLFHTYKDKSGEWRWSLRAGNGAIVADSAEGYSSLAACRQGAERVQANAGSAEID